MNSQLQRFLQVVREPIAALLPGLRVDVSEPYHSTGIWIVNLFLGDYHLMIQFSENKGFGLTSGEEDWDTSVDEVLADAGAAVMRVLELLRSKARTIPSTTLQELRAEKSQREVADAMEIKQPSYARMESEELSKLKVHTLQKIVAASKGKLHLIVETAQGDCLLLGNHTKNTSKENYFCNFSQANEANSLFHSANLAPRNVDFESYEDIWKKALSMSVTHHFGENVGSIMHAKYKLASDKCSLEKFSNNELYYKMFAIYSTDPKAPKEYSSGKKLKPRLVK